METMDPNAASEYLLNSINEVAQLCIPQKMIQEKKSTHRWLTDAVEDLLKATQAVERTPNEREAAEACSAGILRQFIAYTTERAHKLRRFLTDSKGWWTKTRRLMYNKFTVSSLPALKTSKGELIFDPKNQKTCFPKRSQTNTH